MRDLPVEEARARIIAWAGAPVVETVPLDQACGRTLAEPVVAARDQPPFDASAMDGWAVAGEGETFAIVGESAAGHGYAAQLAPGQAVRIFTGAPVPEGAGRVVIQEVATREGQSLRTPPDDGSGRNIRPRGGDFRAGQTLLDAGVRLDPWRVGLAAAAGRASLAVGRRPRVTVLSTGEEIVAPGETPGPDQIFNSGGASLNALIAGWGGEPRPWTKAGDDIEAIVAAASEAGGDVLVTLGGASVGDHDLVKPALARLGLELRVETVKLRPGKPTSFGRLADGRLVLGLPGNPASALVCAELFLRPLLLAMQGADPQPRLAQARLARPMAANGPREHWARGRISYADGDALAEPMSDQDSSLVTVFARADLLIRRRAGAPAAAAGEAVDVLMLERL
jgi:molybdopterin molybdotransferase